MSQRKPKRVLHCSECGSRGHLWMNCPMIRCFYCKQKGHIRDQCPAWLRHQEQLWAQQQLQQKQQQGRSGQLSELQALKKKKEDIWEMVRKFKAFYPECFGSPWDGSPCRPRSLSRATSVGSYTPTTPLEAKEPCSDVKADEAVDRVAEAIYAFQNSSKNPLRVFRNKNFRCFLQQAGRGLFIPCSEEDLMKGDFDILIIHPQLGYIHVEVKAFADSFELLSEEDARKKLIDILHTKAVKTLSKGRRALTYLRPDESVHITSSLALPNVKRQFLRQALEQDPSLRKALGEQLDPASLTPEKTDVESLCLCADDLPPKDGMVDEADESVKSAVNTWWKNITAKAPAMTPPSQKSIDAILTSFFEAESSKTFAELVKQTGDLMETLRLNDRQLDVIRSDQQYLFVTGAPGCGKSLVLAEKALQCLKDGESVFFIFKDGNCTSQPAIECMKQCIRLLHNKGNLEKEFPKLHSLGLPTYAHVEDFVEDLVGAFKNDGASDEGRSKYLKPRRFRGEKDKEDADIKAADNSELQFCFPQLDIKSLQKECLTARKKGLAGCGDGASGETEPCSSTVQPENTRKDSDSEDANSNTEELPSTGFSEVPYSSDQVLNGQGLTLFIDELTWRTINGKRAQLVSEIKRKLPQARIWCAGPFPTDSPEGFHVEKLAYSYRCPPRVQRILEAVEPFCHDEENCVFEYSTRCTSSPTGALYPSQEHQHRLPCEGTDPVFMSHAAHGSGEIIDCRQCASLLVAYLRDKLKVAKSKTTDSGSSENCLTEKDVLIIVSGITCCNNMSRVAFSEFYRQLTADGASYVDSSCPKSSTQQAKEKGRGNDANHKEEETGYDVAIYENSMLGQYDPASSKMSLMHVRAVGGVEKKVVVFVPCYQNQARRAPEVKPLSYADVVRRAPRHGSLPADLVMQKLEKCPHITCKQRQTLAHLGEMNLHWLWHAASRSLSHLVVFHF